MDELALDLEYLPSGAHHHLQSLVVEVKKMLTALHRKLRADS